MRQREAMLGAQAPHELAEDDPELRGDEADVDAHRHAT